LLRHGYTGGEDHAGLLTQSISQDRQRDFVSRRFSLQGRGRLSWLTEACSVNFEQDVADPDAGPVCGAARPDHSDPHSVLRHRFKLYIEFARNLLG
jgi:hypothetical protein